MTQDLFWFVNGETYGFAATCWLMNGRLGVHLLGFGFKEGAD